VHRAVKSATLYQYRLALSDKELTYLQEESRADARQPHDAAAVLFRLKFADNIHPQSLQQ